jgi:hypothetical protein
VTLTLGWTSLFMWIWARVLYMKKKESVTQRKLESGRGPRKGIGTKTDWRLTVGLSITWTLICVIALQLTDPSSCQRGRSTWRRKKVIVTQRNVKFGHLLQRGHATKTNWPTDRRSQYNLILILILIDAKWETGSSQALPQHDPVIAASLRFQQCSPHIG